MTEPTPNQAEPEPKKGVVDVWPLVIADMKERNEIGTKKYGTTLQTQNGRNALVDAYQESLDLVVYLRQRIEEKAIVLNDEQRACALKAFEEKRAKRLEEGKPVDVLDGLIRLVTGAQ